MAGLFDDLIPAGGGGIPHITVRPQNPFADAISSVESGGNYKAVGPATRTGDRALGKYQVMASNVGPWSKEVLGQEITPQEFMANPDIQDAIFNGKFGSYVSKYGPEGAAKAWFAGESGMNDPNRKDSLGTSVTDYARKFSAALPQQAAQPSISFDDLVPQPQAQPQAQPTPQTIGTGEALGRGVASGLTANFYDELRGLTEAGGTKPDEPASLGAVIIGAYKKLTGDPEADARYLAAVARERKAGMQAQEQHPVASAVGNVAGAVALPVGGMLGAATLPARIGRGAAVGAAAGGLYGAGEGENTPDRVSRAASGALIGGAVGGAAPAVLSGVGAVGRAVADKLSPIASVVRGARDVDAEAARRVVTALRRDAGAGLSPQEFAQQVGAGNPVALVDAGGETTRALARSAANTSPEGRAALETLTSDRFGSQNDRAVSFVQGLVQTPGKAQITRDALQAAAERSRAPFYRRAFKDGAGGVWSSEFEQLVQSPVMQSAIKEATASIRNKAATGRAMQPVAPNGAPTLEFWDQVKRSLDSKYNVFQRQGDKEAAADVQALKTALVSKLDAAVPSYPVARGVAASLFKANDALDAGEKFVASKTVSNLDARRALAKMTPEERTLFAGGFASKLIEQVEATADRRNVIGKIYNSPQARERVEIALGANKAKELEAFLRVETIMDRARTAISGNSTTARQLVEAGLAGSAGYGITTGDWNPKSLLTAAFIGGIARKGVQRVDQRVARRVAEMLASNNPSVLQKGVQVVSRNPVLMNALRAFELPAAKISGQQSTGTPVLQLPAVGRADDQPTVPRPPGQ